jgi:hypothetical protein
VDFINQLKFYPGNSKIDANRQDDLDSQRNSEQELGKNPQFRKKQQID